MGLCTSRDDDKIIDVQSTENSRTCCETRFISTAQSCWIAMHQATIALPENVQQSHINSFWKWIESFQYAIPCTHCGNHWRRIFVRLAPHRAQLIQTRNAATSFLFELHNLWNVNKGRPSLSWHKFCIFYKISIDDNITYIPTINTVTNSNIVISTDGEFCSRYGNDIVL